MTLLTCPNGDKQFALNFVRAICVAIWSIVTSAIGNLSFWDILNLLGLGEAAQYVLHAFLQFGFYCQLILVLVVILLVLCVMGRIPLVGKYLPSFVVLVITIVNMGSMGSMYMQSTQSSQETTISGLISVDMTNHMAYQQALSSITETLGAFSEAHGKYDWALDPLDHAGFVNGVDAYDLVSAHSATSSMIVMLVDSLSGTSKTLSSRFEFDTHCHDGQNGLPSWRNLFCAKNTQFTEAHDNTESWLKVAKAYEISKACVPTSITVDRRLQSIGGKHLSKGCDEITSPMMILSHVQGLFTRAPTNRYNCISYQQETNELMKCQGEWTKAFNILVSEIDLKADEGLVSVLCWTSAIAVMVTIVFPLCWYYYQRQQSHTKEPCTYVSIMLTKVALRACTVLPSLWIVSTLHVPVMSQFHAIVVSIECLMFSLPLYTGCCYLSMGSSWNQTVKKTTGSTDKHRYQLTENNTLVLFTEMKEERAVKAVITVPEDSNVITVYRDTIHSLFELIAFSPVKDCFVDLSTKDFKLDNVYCRSHLVVVNVTSGCKMMHIDGKSYLETDGQSWNITTDSTAKTTSTDEGRVPVVTKHTGKFTVDGPLIREVVSAAIAGNKKSDLKRSLCCIGGRAS